MRDYYLNKEYRKVHAEGAVSADHPTNVEKRLELGGFPSMSVAVARARNVWSKDASACQLCDRRL